jgi:lactate permease
MPYGLLVLFVVLWGAKPIQLKLSSMNVSFPWPILHDRIIRTAPISATPQPYHAVFLLNWFAASGTSCMMAAICSALFLRVSPKQFLRILLHVLRQIAIPTATVTSVLAMAFLMNYSGATATLGLAFAASGVFFPFFSALLGWLGVFLTGSDTSANALFGNLQVVTAGRLGLSPVLMAAANSVGGTMGKMISLQTIAVAAAATGMSVSDQAKLFRFTLKHSILLATVVGLLALLFAYKIHF